MNVLEVFKCCEFRPHFSLALLIVAGCELRGEESGKDAFKRLLDSPPVIERLIYTETLPPENKSPLSYAEGILGSSNYFHGLLRWQEGAFLFAELNAPNVEEGYRLSGRDFLQYDGLFTFIHSRTNTTVYQRAEDTLDRVSVSTVEDTAVYRTRRRIEPITLGISHLLPGQVEWEGDQFRAVGIADRKAVDISGEILSLSDSRPDKLAVRYASDVGAADYVIHYSYENPDILPFPNRIENVFHYQGKEILYREYEISDVSLGTESLPKSMFTPELITQMENSTTHVATNGTFYLKLDGGQLLEVPSGVAPKTKLSKGDYWQNRYVYAFLLIVIVGYGAYFVRSGALASRKAE